MCIVQEKIFLWPLPQTCRSKTEKTPSFAFNYARLASARLKSWRKLLTTQPLCQPGELLLVNAHAGYSFTTCYRCNHRTLRGNHALWRNKQWSPAQASDFTANLAGLCGGARSGSNRLALRVPWQQNSTNKHRRELCHTLIFSKSSHFVLGEAASQTKYGCSPKGKHFASPKKFRAVYAIAHKVGALERMCRKVPVICAVTVERYAGGYLWLSGRKSATEERGKNQEATKRKLRSHSRPSQTE